MNISHIKVICGPNQWSDFHRRLLVACFTEDEPTAPAICAKTMEELVPGTSASLLSEQDLSSAIGMIGDIAVRLLQLTGFNSGFQKTWMDREGCEHQLVIEYEEAKTGKKALESACRIYKAVKAGEPIVTFDLVRELKEILESEKLGPSTMSIYKEAVSRGIPVMRLDEQSLLQLGYGARQKRVEATMTDGTSIIAVDIAGDKHRTKQLLASSYLPVPDGVVIKDPGELDEAIRKVGFPLVIKPLDGNKGRGASINLSSAEEAKAAFEIAQTICEKVVVEQYVNGKDFRVLVVNKRFVAAAKRNPASVTGDGKLTIGELIVKENLDPRRSDGHSNLLTRLPADECTAQYLAKQGKNFDTIPAEGEKVVLRSTANLSTGGTAEDVTGSVHPANISLFERTARTVGLDICGIDIMAEELSTPITENGGRIIEVNAAPGIRMHLQPGSGEPRNVAKPIVDMLFEHGDDGRIPIVAITGTNGKTTTTRLIARMAQQHGFNTGYTTTDGIYLNKEQVCKGDCSGPQSAKFILRDSAVEFAVLETARGGIIRSGLAFDSCDCAVITNIAEDHLGLNGVHTIKELARVKETVARSVRQGGWVVLNADDDLVYAMRDHVKGNVALFSLHPDSKRIRLHCEAGGTAAICDEGYIMIRQANTILPIEEIENVPLTYGGKAKFNVANALGATLASWLMKISLPAIRCSLRNFRNSTESTPGRLNVFDFGDFSVIMDYAHNPHGLKALGEFIHSIPASKRVGVIAAVGDRRAEDIISVGEIAGRIFDDVIIKMDEDLRGRSELELYSLLRTGVQRSAPDKPAYYFSNETESVEYAVQTAPPGSLVVVLVDNIREVSEKIRELKEMRKNKDSAGMKMAV